jgi:phospholipase C
MWTGWVGNDGSGGAPVIDNAEAGYDWSTYPERRGSLSGANAANLEIRAACDSDGDAITLFGANRGTQTVTVQLTNAYTGETISGDMAPGVSGKTAFSVSDHWGWYDLIVEVEQDPTFRYQFAGHLENGRESRTDPAIAS